MEEQPKSFETINHEAQVSNLWKAIQPSSGLGRERLMPQQSPVIEAIFRRFIFYPPGHSSLRGFTPWPLPDP